MFDDPLSALDLKVGTYIMENTIMGQLQGKTRIIVTHAIQYIKYADRILIMEEGRIIKQGTYSEVQDTPLFLELLQIFQKDKNNLDKNLENKENEIKKEKTVNEMRDELRLLKDKSSYDNDDTKQVEKLFFAEDRKMGQVSMKLFIQVLNRLGGWWVFLLIFLVTLFSNLLSVYTIQYLLEWSKQFDVEDKWWKYTILCTLMLSRCIFSSLRLLILYLLGCKVSLKIHAKMFFHIIHAKLHEF